MWSLSFMHYNFWVIGKNGLNTCLTQNSSDVASGFLSLSFPYKHLVHAVLILAFLLSSSCSYIFFLLSVFEQNTERKVSFSFSVWRLYFWSNKTPNNYRNYLKKKKKHHKEILTHPFVNRAGKNTNFIPSLNQGALLDSTARSFRRFLDTVQCIKLYWIKDILSLRTECFKVKYSKNSLLLSTFVY